MTRKLPVIKLAVIYVFLAANDNLVNVKSLDSVLLKGLVEKWVKMLTLLKIGYRTQFLLQLMLILLLKSS